MCGLRFLLRDIRIQLSYVTAFILQLAGIAFAVPFFFFAAKVFEGADLVALDRYGGNYFAFILLGIAFVDYSALSMRVYNESLRESQLMGTLEIVLLSPLKAWEILVYSSLWGYLFTTLRFLTYITVGAIFGLELGNVNIISVIVTLLVSIVAFASLGMLIASIVVVIKKGDGLTAMVNAASSFFGGVIYPVDVLPGFLQNFAQVLPITHALEAMRLAVLQGAGLVELAPLLAKLIIFAAIFIPIALLCFRRAVDLNKVAGTLGQY
ncbi:MAG: ABC transporter permease [Mangrovicoccus sp.]